MNEIEKKARHYVYETFLETARPPMAEEVMRRFELGRAETERLLESLGMQKSLALVPGTHRILMAWPFSAVATPFSVRLRDGKEYFANCAWDAVAFHVMLEQAVEINSFCHHSGERIWVKIHPEGKVETESPCPLVYLARPASKWWLDIVDTCSNTMVFFSSEGNLEEWLAHAQPSERGVALSIEQTIELSVPIYRGRMGQEYARPPVDAIRQHFTQMGLSGPFWEL